MLPKSVRQIGQIEGNKRIYIEDYVMTYARKIEGMAVLLGKEETIEGKNIFYISGAVSVKNTVFGYPMTLTNEDWSAIYEDVKKYFMDYEIAGWLLVRKNVALEIDEEIRTIHEENFRGNNKILFLFDKGEGEEAFYLSDSQGNLRKQRGYYIYYEKNEPMQSYMVEKNEGEKVEEYKQDEAMEKVREIVAGKETVHSDKKLINLMYGASTLLAAVVLVIGVTTLDNYDKMKNMEQTLNVISDNLEGSGNETDDLVVEVEQVMGNTKPVETQEVPENVQEPEESQGPDESSEEKNDEKEESEKVTEAENQTEEETEEKTEEKTEEQKEEKNEEQTQKSDEKEEKTDVKETSAAVKNAYTVKNGDTLASISMKFYKSYEYIEIIKELNGIENGDIIFADQILLLP